MRLSPICSMQWAVHPLIRATTKIGVNTRTGRPSAVDAGRRPVEVGPETLAVEHDRLDPCGEFLEPLAVGAADHVAAQPAQEPGPHVAVLVHAMAEAHHDLLRRELLLEPGLCPLGAADAPSTSRTFSLAPPCSGPLRAPIAAVMAEWMSEPVETTVRAANVEALNSCSA